MSILKTSLLIGTGFISGVLTAYVVRRIKNYKEADGNLVVCVNEKKEPAGLYVELYSYDDIYKKNEVKFNVIKKIIKDKENGKQ